MQVHRLTATPVDLDALIDEFELPGSFPPAVIAAANDAAVRPLTVGIDARDVPLVTIDPPGTRDLDQAVAIDTRPGGGWVVHYAIADVGAFVDPGGPIDTEARRRGETIYAPGRRIPLHPDVLGEGAMSLLPGRDRPAILWRIDVDGDGATGAVDVRRAMVRSRACLDYPGVQGAADTGTLPDAIAALPAFGETRHRRALDHGAIELNLPEQVVQDNGTTWTLTYRSPLPVEVWNAQVSLLTGAAAAQIMLDGGIGLLRTLPPPPALALERLRRAAPGLGVAWPDDASPGQVIAGLDLTDPRHVAFAELAATLLRGAGYAAFDGAPPPEPGHAGVGDVYAHATAPIRRLGDRFVNEVCVALAAGAAVPDWARSSLEVLPDVLADSARRSRAFDRAIVDGTEAWVLQDHVGSVFDATVVDVEPAHRGGLRADPSGPGERGRAGRPAGASTSPADTASRPADTPVSERGTVMLETPAVSARVDGVGLPLGAKTEVRLQEADPATRRVRFRYPV